MLNPTPEGEDLARRLKLFKKHCGEISIQQLKEASENDIAELKCSVAILDHLAWRGPRG